MARGTGRFAYDAYGYWTAAQRLVGTSPVSPEFFWALRGVLAGFVYVPAAVLSKIIGAPTAGFSVLLQNSLVLAGVAAFLLPSFLKPWRELSDRARWSGAFLIWLAVGGFARYPLIDIYAAIACLVIVVLLRRGGARFIGLAGLVGGAALNLRPAYVVTILMIAVVVLAWQRWTGLLFSAGVAVSLIPQVTFNVIRFATWSVSPAGSGGMVGLQAGMASYIVRYDTLLGAEAPAKFYCSPTMANQVGTTPPLSMSQLATFFLDHFSPCVCVCARKGLGLIALDHVDTVCNTDARPRRPVRSLHHRGDGLGIGSSDQNGSPIARPAGPTWLVHVDAHGGSGHRRSSHACQLGHGDSLRVAARAPRPDRVRDVRRHGPPGRMGATARVGRRFSDRGPRCDGAGIHGPLAPRAAWASRRVNLLGVVGCLVLVDGGGALLGSPWSPRVRACSLGPCAHFSADATCPWSSSPMT